MKFKLTYRNGNSELITTDAETVEDQCNRSFGMSLEEARDFGSNVEIYEEPKGAPTEKELQDLADQSDKDKLKAETVKKIQDEAEDEKLRAADAGEKADVAAETKPVPAKKTAKKK